MGGFWGGPRGTDCVLGRILDLGVAVLVPELILDCPMRRGLCGRSFVPWSLNGGPFFNVSF